LLNFFNSSTALLLFGEIFKELRLSDTIDDGVRIKSVVVLIVLRLIWGDLVLLALFNRQL
jgi:hypothetical protein